MGGRWTYEQRHIKCGKPKCRCADGTKHGPYWYGFRRRRDGKLESKYFGKSGPHLDARRSNEPKDYTSALRTFGLLRLRQPPTARQIQLAYKHLKEKHREDVKRLERIVAAYEVLRRRHGGAAS